MDLNQDFLSDDHRTRSVVQRSEWTASESVALSVINTVAAISNKKPTELPLLYEAVDPEALEKLVQSRQSQSLEVKFRYYGYLVTIASDGEILVSH